VVEFPSYFTHQVYFHHPVRADFDIGSKFVNGKEYFVANVRLPICVHQTRMWKYKMRVEYIKCHLLRWCVEFVDGDNGTFAKTSGYVEKSMRNTSTLSFTSKFFVNLIRGEGKTAVLNSLALRELSKRVPSKRDVNN